MKEFDCLNKIEAVNFEQRKIWMKNFDPSNPEKMIAEAEIKATAARADGHESDAFGWLALRALCIDEIARFKMLRKKKKKSDDFPQKEYDRAIKTYAELLAVSSQWPPEFMPFVSAKDILSRVSDLLANKEAYTNQRPTNEELKQAKACLRQATVLSKQYGLETEYALIGLLRYGKNFHDINTLGRSSEDLEHIFADPRMKNPSGLMVQHAMPREDYYNAGVFKGNDLLWLMPDEKEPQAYQLKVKPVGEKPGVLWVNGEEAISLWNDIGEEKCRINSVEQMNLWHQRYNALMRNIREQLKDQRGAKYARQVAEIVWPFDTEWVRHVDHEATPAVSFDQVVTFRWINLNWSKLVEAGIIAEFDPKNILGQFTQIKQAIKMVYLAQPENELWTEIGLGVLNGK